MVAQVWGTITGCATSHEPRPTTGGRREGTLGGPRLRRLAGGVFLRDLSSLEPKTTPTLGSSNVWIRSVRLIQDKNINYEQSGWWYRRARNLLYTQWSLSPWSGVGKSQEGTQHVNKLTQVRSTQLKCVIPNRPETRLHVQFLS